MFIIVNNERGFSLVEVLVAFSLLIIIFSLIGSLVVNSVSQSSRIDDRFSAVELADSLLDTYQNFSFEELENMTGNEESIDIMTSLELTEEPPYEAFVKIMQHDNPELQDRLLVITITVTPTSSTNNSVTLEGLKRK
ncbi:type IV pilus modification PilV family protein [Thalassobacillus hwangdonensis]|uniref:Prepilin-type N-terminal cleavage/methylation domain-containing protein n=1 Tax=Thalassobacillus hwangdonensis TaxID=546108 RepID=A0ABW3L2W7_9BACI